jgi:UDP-2-acetamido-2-deoxy-ribo-hexuluronate aminotransferase
MDFIDLKTQYSRLETGIRDRIDAVLRHGQYILGPEVAELEAALAGHVGVDHCVGVASGTDALLVALMALDIGPGDEVICPAFSFIATSEVVQLLGAKPVFADIRPDTFNVCPESVRQLVGGQTRAILAVSLYGQVADMDELGEIADSCGAVLIEDAAQSFGAEYRGRKSCGLSPVAVTSFFPSKPLGAYGDAGAVFCDDAALAKILRQVSTHGQARRYEHVRLGVNGRLDTIQAAVLMEKLTLFDEEVLERRQRAARYDELIGESCPAVITPPVLEHNLSVYAQYTIRVENRDQLRQKLQEEGIPTAVHYPIPLNRQESVRDFDAEVPESDAAAATVLSLPMHPYLGEAQQQEIVRKLAELT